MTARPGELRHRLTIEQAARTGDGGGGAEQLWTAIAEIWAKVEAMSGGEDTDFDRISGKAAYRITIRYRSGIAPEMRFRRGIEIFEILAILDEDGRGRFLTCKCERQDL